jgi:hypothetical protein
MRLRASYRPSWLPRARVFLRSCYTTTGSRVRQRLAQMHAELRTALKSQSQGACAVQDIAARVWPAREPDILSARIMVFQVRTG